VKALYPFLFSLTLPVVPLLVVAVISTYVEKKLPFGMGLEQAETRIFWGEAFFRLLWGVLFFDLIPAWILFRFEPQLFPSLWITALATPALIFIFGYLPLVVLLSSRFNFNWGYIFFTLLWIFAAFALSLAAIQIAYRL
jgi:hypothetical protein